MKKKELENEELDDEIIEEEVLAEEDEEVLDDEPILDDEEEIEEEIEEELPKKKAKSTKPGKKPMKKGAKIAIITSSSVIAVAAIAVILIVFVLPLIMPSQTATLKEVDFSTLVPGYEKAPEESGSSTEILDAIYYKAPAMEAYYNSATADNKNLVAAQMIFAAYKNIATAYQYSYFANKVGTTELNGGGTLVEQRLRRQNQTQKDDTTLKLPINHHFNTFYVLAVTGEKKNSIRYIKDGKIYRIKSMEIAYNEETGLLECSKWKANKDAKWANDDPVSGSANITEARLNYLSLVKNMRLLNDGETDDIMDITQPKAIFKKNSARIEDKGDYYEIYVETDSKFASSDSDTLGYFKEDNGATDVTISKCIITMQIWKCGLPKSVDTEEKWSGNIEGFSGDANVTSQRRYSYDDTDCNDMSVTDAIWKSVK